MKAVTLDIGNDLESHFAVTFKQAHDCDFADSSRANSLGFLPALVHEPRGSADVGFVGLNVVLQSVERLVLQGQPDAMIHEPCGLLGDMEIAANLVGTDTVLAVDHHPQSGEPFRERSGESSKVVPTFTENSRRGWCDPHCQVRRLVLNLTRSEPHRGHLTTPSGQRFDASFRMQLSGSS